MGWDGVDGRMMIVSPTNKPNLPACPWPIGRCPGDQFSASAWTFGGASWQQVAAPGVTHKAGLFLAYDSGRGREVLVDGILSAVETWEWDG